MINLYRDNHETEICFLFTNHIFTIYVDMHWVVV